MIARPASSVSDDGVETDSITARGNSDKIGKVTARDVYANWSKTQPRTTCFLSFHLLRPTSATEGR